VHGVGHGASGGGRQLEATLCKAAWRAAAHGAQPRMRRMARGGAWRAAAAAAAAAAAVTLGGSLVLGVV